MTTQIAIQNETNMLSLTCGVLFHKKKKKFLVLYIINEFNTNRGPLYGLLAVNKTQLKLTIPSY